MSACTVLRRKPVRLKLFWIGEVFGIPVYVIERYQYVSSRWNTFFDCFPEMKRDWREKSQSLFENLKHNKLHSDIIQLLGEK
jgi:hypothetical protein